ncbi:MAG: glycosyltransferase family 39 protein [Anaerolineae bacterium]
MAVQEAGHRSLPARTLACIGSNCFPLGVFLVSRLGLFLFTYFSLILIPLGKSRASLRPYPGDLLLDGWVRADSMWYASIADKGYSATPSGGQLNTAFLPLYPLVTHVVRLIVPDTFIAGLVVSNVAFLLALIVLYKLILRHYDTDVARRSLVLLAVFPFSLYFSAMYTESLFLLTVLLAFYFGERQRWLLAALAAAAASATRLVGIFTGVALVILYLESAAFQWRKVRPNIAWLALSGAGLLAFMGYLGVRFGDPVAFYTAQSSPGWGFHDFNDAVQLIRDSLVGSALLKGDYPALDLIHLLLMLAAIVGCALAWRRPRISYAVWGILVIVASFPEYVGMGRYVAVVFPLFILGGLALRDNRWYLAVVYISTLFLALFTIMYSHAMWLS